VLGVRARLRELEPGVEHIGGAGGVRRGEHDPAARSKVPPRRPQKAGRVLQVLDHLARDDRVELAAQVEVLGVGHSHLRVPVVAQIVHFGVFQVDAVDVAERAVQVAVQPLGRLHQWTVVLQAASAPDVQHGWAARHPEDRGDALRRPPDEVGGGGHGSTAIRPL